MMFRELPDTVGFAEYSLCSDREAGTALAVGFLGLEVALKRID